MLLSVYIKRYANLVLLSADSTQIHSGELALAVAEVLRYLNLYGIPGELMNNGQGKVSAEAVLTVFEVCEALMEECFYDLEGVYVNLLDREAVTLVKLTLENARPVISQALFSKLTDAGVRVTAEQEEEIAYLSFSIPRGGDEV